jgi:hypothetical protein
MLGSAGAEHCSNELANPRLETPMLKPDRSCFKKRSSCILRHDRDSRLSGNNYSAVDWHSGLRKKSGEWILDAWHNRDQFLTGYMQGRADTKLRTIIISETRQTDFVRIKGHTFKYFGVSVEYLT